MAFVQLLTALLHCLSFLTSPQGSNETEMELINLMTTYKLDMGAGFRPTMYHLYTAMSACFALLCVFGGWLNLFLWNQRVSSSTLRGIAAMNVVIFGICFLMMALFTFLPSIILTGLIWLFGIGAYFAASRR